MKEIRTQDTLLAILLPSTYREEGIHFFTPPEFSQQLGYMKRPPGYCIAPHIHKLVERQIAYTQETIFVRSGKVRVDIYTPDKKYHSSEVLSTGDALLLAAGGHGFEFLEESELIEVKQGPYLSFEVDKERSEAGPSRDAKQ